MIGVVFLIVLAVAGLVAFAYYTDQDLITSSVTGIKNYIPDVDCNVAGDCVEFFIPLVTDSSDTVHQTVPVGYTIDEVTGAMYYQNGTEVPTESYITGNINDLSYSRQGVPQSKYQAVGKTMQVQIGNIASIEGQIKIIDPVTKEIVEPRTAKYSMTIQCSELTEFCNLSPISRRGTTTTAGTFLEKWTTNYKNTEGLYEVEIFAQSETKDEFDRYYEVTNTLYIELYK